MLEAGDRAIIREDFKGELYPALERFEGRMTKTVADAIALHHANCPIKDTVQRFEVTVSHVKTEAELAAAKASNAALQATQIKQNIDARFNQVWGGWRVLLVLGGAGGFIVMLLEALATMGYLHK
jgi:hypothetical protein